MLSNTALSYGVINSGSWSAITSQRLLLLITGTSRRMLCSASVSGIIKERIFKIEWAWRITAPQATDEWNLPVHATRVINFPPILVGSHFFAPFPFLLPLPFLSLLFPFLSFPSLPIHSPPQTQLDGMGSSPAGFWSDPRRQRIFMYLRLENASDYINFPSFN